MAIAVICLGIFFIASQSVNKPIRREEAVSYSGAFLKYESSGRYCEIYFKDSSCYEVYPHTEKRAFRDAMKSLEEGTILYILQNPNNHYVVEVRTDTEEILNFEQSQKDIDRYGNGYIFLGIVACVSGTILLIFVILETIYKRKETARQAKRKEYRIGAETDSPILRKAGTEAKSKILLEAKFRGYEICYRRMKTVNELVINGWVYDEKKGLLEFEHRLCATVDGHMIEAGYDENSFSYILFDGQQIASKQRSI